VDAEGDWFEVRSTAMGVLGDLDLPYGEPDPDRSYPEILSLVIDRSEGRVRELPAFFFGTARVYSDRDLDKVTSRLVTTYKDVVRAPHVPTFQINACRVGERYGLYLGDFFNRSAARIRLRRQGMEFAESPFVRFQEDESFECDDWGAFRPSFLALTGKSDEPTELVRPSRGYLLLSFASLRLGDTSQPEVARLANVLRGLDAVGAADAATLVAELAA
jgi:hypothetical protein